MRIALFAGTFDPPSLGHLDMIKRAAGLFDKLYVGLAVNTSKKSGIFSTHEKMDLLKKITGSYGNVEVISFDGLVVDFAKKNNVSVFIRGMRPFHDFEQEYAMAVSNKEMTGIETLFLIADKDVAHISSSLIREIAHFGRRLHGFVPEEIEQDVFLGIQKFIAERAKED